MWTRRALLKAGGLTLLSLGWGSAPAFLARAAEAAPGPAAATRRKTLVTIFLRGAMDGLAAVPPVDSARLRKLRPRLALGAARSAGAGDDQRCLDLGVGFGLHPAFEPLLPLWQDGRLAVVHAVGSPDPTRSHFDAQDYMETGTPGRKGTSSGWLNRVGGLLGHEATPWRSVATTASLPRSLAGPAPALAVEDLDTLRAVGLRAEDAFGEAYGATADDLLGEAGRNAFEVARALERLRPADYRPARNARYPQGALGDSLKQVAMWIKAGLGLEVAFVESNGWDTHLAQRVSFGARARDLSQALAAFWTDLGSHRDDVVVITPTEFGRTVAENGSGGTDHGHGSCMFVLGNDVAGGRVHGRFPGLDRDVLYEGRDLPVTTDFRAVFAEVAGRHLGITDDAAVFPGWGGKRIPLWRA